MLIQLKLDCVLAHEHAPSKSQLNSLIAGRVVVDSVVVITVVVSFLGSASDG